MTPDYINVSQHVNFVTLKCYQQLSKSLYGSVKKINILNIDWGLFNHYVVLPTNLHYKSEDKEEVSSKYIL